MGTVTSNSGGTLLLTFNTSATSSRVDQVIQQIAYSNSGDSCGDTVQIDYAFSDGNTGGQGTGGALQSSGSVTVTIQTRPTVTTGAVSSITHLSAASGGTVVDIGCTSAMDRGVCWSTSTSPTISDSCTSDGSGSGGYTSAISGLASSTLYYVRAFATNASGTAYGTQTSNGVGNGGSVALTLYLPEGARPISYIKYGPTPTDDTDRWYEFMVDGATGAAGSKLATYFVAGLGFSHIDETILTRYSAANYQLTIANEIYPMFRLGFPLSGKYGLELGARWEIYSGSIDRTNNTGSDNLRSTTFLLGPVYTGDESVCKRIGPFRPIAAAKIVYSAPYEKLKYPAIKFKPAIGCDVAFGFVKRNADFRVGYRYLKLKRDRILAGVDESASEDELSASGFFFELSYRFSYK